MNDTDGGVERICSCPTVSYWEDWGEGNGVDIGLVLVTEITGHDKRCPTHGKPRWDNDDQIPRVPGGHRRHDRDKG